MISFAVNQQVGKKIPKVFWQNLLKKIEKILKLKRKTEISIALVDSKTIKNLNRIYRGKNQVTDVLSFSELDSKEGKRGALANYLGEVIICYPQMVKQAKNNAKTIKQELALLLVHGVLHLFGHDHKKATESQIMRDLAAKILGKVDF